MLQCATVLCLLVNLYLVFFDSEVVGHFVAGSKIAVLGAVSNIGGEVLDVLYQRSADEAIKIREVVALATGKSVGRQVSYGFRGSKVLDVCDAISYDFSDVDVVIALGSCSKEKGCIPIATDAGSVVIEHDSALNLDEKMPLVVSGVNTEDIKNYVHHSIVASPSSCVVSLTTVLKLLERLAPIKRVNVSTYQAVSNLGKSAVNELYEQTKSDFMYGAVAEKVFSKKIAFNCIPQVGRFMDDGFTEEEHKIIHETKKVLNMKNLKIQATCVYVPVFMGNALAVNIEFAGRIAAEDVRDLLMTQRKSWCVAYG